MKSTINLGRPGRFSIDGCRKPCIQEKSEASEHSAVWAGG